MIIEEVYDALLEAGASEEKAREFVDAPNGIIGLESNIAVLLTRLVATGRLPLARSLYEEARELAADAGDVVLAVHVLINQSMLCAAFSALIRSASSAK